MSRNYRPPHRRRQDEPSVVAAILKAAGHIGEISKALGRTQAFVVVIIAMGLLSLRFMPQPLSPLIHLAAIAAFVAMALCVPLLLGRDDG